VFKHLPVTAATSLIDTSDKAAMLSLMNAVYDDVSAKIAGVEVVAAAKRAKLFSGVAEVSSCSALNRQGSCTCCVVRFMIASPTAVYKQGCLLYMLLVPLLLPCAGFEQRGYPPARHDCCCQGVR
jgi:hypothetical protein